MSYAVRNTIILLVTLLLIGGAAFSYIKFYQEAHLETLQETQQEKLQDYNTKKATSDSYPALNEKYQQALDIVENYDKALYRTNNPDDIFDYLDLLSDGNSRIYFGYVFVDSLEMDQYGIINSDITGFGNYENLVRFINKLENSQLLNKVREISISPQPEDGNYSNVSFSFALESYYQRQPIQDVERLTQSITLNQQISTYNPFYALIRSTIPPNEGGLINVESSRLIGMSGSKIFLVDQNGTMQTLQEGDNVYLGYLQSIDAESKTATFNLNKGGITELVTLEIAQ